MSINLEELGNILVKVECCDEVVGGKLELKSKLDEMKCALASKGWANTNKERFVFESSTCFARDFRFSAFLHSHQQH